MEGSWALGVALGHVRCAVAAFVAAEDLSGESVFLAADCLDLEGVFADCGVEPQLVDVYDHAREPAESVMDTMSPPSSPKASDASATATPASTCSGRSGPSRGT